MKLIGATCCAIALCVGGLGAQTRETETKSKVTVAEGKSVTLSGCIAPAASGTGFLLTNVADPRGDVHDYMLVSANESELAKHVGHLVELSGKVTDQGDAKIKTETKTTTKVEGGDDRESTRKTESKGEVGRSYFGVNSVKMIAATCP